MLSLWYGAFFLLLLNAHSTPHLSSASYLLPVSETVGEKSYADLIDSIKKEFPTTPEKEVVEAPIEYQSKSSFRSFSLENALEKNYSLPLVLLAAFFAGILASFTPCIYPMIPITLGIITAQKSASMITNFFLAWSYGMGIATVYAGLGYISATSSIIFGQWLAHPLFIFLMILLFLYLAFSMFGFYEMYTPRILQQRSTFKYRGGSFAYSYLFGILSGAAASPCLTPALALLLGFVAKQGNALVGLSVLFSFALGMSMLLIMVGTFSSSLSLLPQAGMWMVEIKKIFGFFLLGVCIYFLQPIAHPVTISLLYALLMLIAASYYAMLAQKQPAHARITLLFLAVLLGLLGSLFLYSAHLQSIGSSLGEVYESILETRSL